MKKRNEKRNIHPIQGGSRGPCHSTNNRGSKKQTHRNPFIPIPIPSMYGIFNYIWLIFMVNVGKYTIHGLYDGIGVEITPFITIGSGCISCMRLLEALPSCCTGSTTCDQNWTISVYGNRSNPKVLQIPINIQTLWVRIGFYNETHSHLFQV